MPEPLASARWQRPICSRLSARLRPPQIPESLLIHPATHRLVTGLTSVLVLGCSDAEPPAEIPHPEMPAVIEAVDQLFASMRGRDTVLLRELLADDSRLIAVTDAGARPSNLEAFLARISAPGEELHERMWDPEVRIEGPIATVWTPYDFHVGGDFSHCGIDAFQLTQSEGRWRIVSIIYTIQTEGCDASPLGPPT